MVGIIISIALLGAIYGCATVLVAGAGGVGTAFWLSGKLSETVAFPREKVVDATRAALKSMNMEIEKETEAADVTQLITKYTDGSKTWIDIRPIAKDSSKIEIRVGVRGNKSASNEILQKIKKNLSGWF